MTNPSRASPRVLVVDDDDGARRHLVRGLTRQGFVATPAEGGREAMTRLEEEAFEAVVCDLLMPEVDGLDVLRHSRTLPRAPAFVVLTAHGNVGVAVDAMKLGALDFLEKPASLSEIEAALRTALGHALAAEPDSRMGKRRIESGLVGSDSWLVPFSQLLEKIATTDAIVLVEGETGTGKSAVAREIWRLSKRRRGPFIEVNCAAIAKDLVENELFGNVKGAFTGALGQAGKVEKANGGTLFLDEIGELALELQAKLLQLLQEKTYTPVGGTSLRKADVRFLAATNRLLEQEARAGRFRADLYYRLEVVKLTIPPLRERIDDVPVLLEHFRRAASTQNGRAPVFPPDTVDALCRHDWPGNIRELENLVFRLSVMLEGGEEVTPEHLPERIRVSSGALPGVGEAPTPPCAHPTATLLGSDSDPPQPPTIEEVVRDGLASAMKTYESGIIRAALEQTKDNVTQAAKLLRMKRTTLIEKRRRYEDLGLL